MLGEVHDRGGNAARARQVRELIQTSARSARGPGELLEQVNAELVGPIAASAVAVLSDRPAATCGGPAPGTHRAPARHRPRASRLRLRRAARHANAVRGTELAGASGVLRAGLVLHTDGVLDAPGPHGIPVGDVRLTRLLCWLDSRRPGCALDELTRTVCHFAAHALPDDAAAAIIAARPSRRQAGASTATMTAR